MNKDINWDDLRVLLKVTECGSFLGASRELGVATSTVSRRITQLEQKLNSLLVERGVDGTELTAQGHVMVGIAQSMSIELDREQQKNEATKNQLTGVIRFTSGDGFVPILTQIISKFTEENPKCHIEYIVGHEYKNIARNEIDVGIRTSNLEEPSLVYKKLGSIEYGFYGTPEYLALHNKTNPPTKMNYISLLPPLANEAHLLTARTFGFSESYIRLSSLVPQIQMIQAGLGIGVIPKALSEGLEPVDVDIELPKLPILLATRRQALQQPHIRAFVDILYREFSQALADEWWNT
jgi:DNA-binding transcriptional LysR family regulator